MLVNFGETIEWQKLCCGSYTSYDLQLCNASQRPQTILLISAIPTNLERLRTGGLKHD